MIVAVSLFCMRIAPSYDSRIYARTRSHHGLRCRGVSRSRPDCRAFVMSADVVEVGAILLSAFGMGWIIGRGIKAVRQFLDLI